MAKATSSANKITKINVRMYRAGTGDFFILQFKSRNSVKFNMMIDCGCINAGKTTFVPMIEDLQSITGGVIDLLVVTHEHADHINGFEKSALMFKQFTFKNVWFAWTEDENDPIANEYRANHSELGLAINLATNKLNQLVKEKFYEETYEKEFAAPLMIEGRKKFIHALSDLNVMNRTNGLAVGSVLPSMVKLFTDFNVIKAGTNIEFLEPGDFKVDLPGAKGIRFYVLGPPRKRTYLNLTERKGETFEKREEKSEVDHAFVSALAASDTTFTSNIDAFDHSYESGEKSSPIQKQYDAKSNTWRAIEHDWLYSAGTLAMRYERSINNTSLALAIQFEETEKVLLFPGDAEFGNWESWHDELEWPVKINGNTINKKAEYFLNKTVFYKVGHHFSHNGSPLAKGVGMMTSPELAAMATLDFKRINHTWLNTMPNDLLGAELLRKTKGQLYFCGDRRNILPNIKTDRVTIKKTHENAFNTANKKFDGKIFIDYEVKA
ncbi:MAG: hypothetical protein H7Y31_15150 [Chitinophagaceae bacterium]|nr:hypothetical protein [Chitinophagaceae bacterium]